MRTGSGNLSDGIRFDCIVTDGKSDTTSITIPKALRDDLLLLKIITEEPWYKVIRRLVDEHNAKTVLKKKK